jgi:rubredoxin
MNELQYVRCKYCRHRWQGVRAPLSEAIAAGEPIPGKDLKCPQCGLDGATIVLDSDPQGQLI